MRAIRTSTSNHSIGPPAGQEGEIGALPCEIVDTDLGRFIYSTWVLSDEERQAIANGLNIRLGVGDIGAFPPVSLGVTHDGTETTASLTEGSNSCHAPPVTAPPPLR